MTSIEAQKYVKEAFKITWDLGYSPRTRREIAYLITSIPENLRYYFDFKAFGRDMSFEGHFVFTDSGNCIEII